MNNQLNHQLKKIVEDNTSGSKEILQKLHLLLKDSIDNVTIDMIVRLKKDFQSFQSIRSYLDDLQKAIDQNKLEDFIESFDKHYISIYDTIYHNFKKEVNKKNIFLTISNSTTLFEIFKRYAMENKELKVIISEGRPVLEGRILAEKLSNQNIDVTLITEAQSFEYLRKVEAVVIGADKLLANSNVVNKTGSNNLAVLANYFGKSFYVIADSSKKSKETKYEPEEKSFEEIWENKPGNVKISNRYFEVIDKKLITRIITE